MTRLRRSMTENRIGELLMSNGMITAEDLHAALREIAFLLERTRESTYRVRAYRDAAATLLGLPEAEVRERVGLLAGLDEGTIGTCLAERITPMPGARTLLATLKHFGCRTVLVTGGFHHFADPVAEDLGFERVVANRLAVGEGKLAGELVGGITDSAVKAQVLREEMERLGENAISLATGDGANDIPMLQAADWGVAYHAKPKAREAANGWIDRGDLTSILKLLEIPERDWQAR